MARDKERPEEETEEQEQRQGTDEEGEQPLPPPLYGYVSLGAAGPASDSGGEEEEDDDDEEEYGSLDCGSDEPAEESEYLGEAAEAGAGCGVEEDLSLADRALTNIEAEYLACSEAVWTGDSSTIGDTSAPVEESEAPINPELPPPRDSPAVSAAEGGGGGAGAPAATAGSSGTAKHAPRKAVTVADAQRRAAEAKRSKKGRTTGAPATAAAATVAGPGAQGSLRPLSPPPESATPQWARGLNWESLDMTKMLHDLSAGQASPKEKGRN